MRNISKLGLVLVIGYGLLFSFGLYEDVTCTPQGFGFNCFVSVALLLSLPLSLMGSGLDTLSVGAEYAIFFVAALVNACVLYMIGKKISSWSGLEVFPQEDPKRKFYITTAILILLVLFLISVSWGFARNSIR